MSMLYNELLDLNLEAITANKVGYYWEGADCAPVIEVFSYETVESVKAKLSKIRNTGILAESENLENGKYDSNGLAYHRLFFTFNPYNMTIAQIIECIEKLSNYGHSKYILK